MTVKKRTKANDGASSKVDSVPHKQARGKSSQNSDLSAKFESRWAIYVLAGFLMLVYNIDDTYLMGKDASGNISLILQILTKGTMVYSPKEDFKLFEWEFNYSFDPSFENYTISTVHSWTPDVDYYFQEGRLRIESIEYFISPTHFKYLFVPTFGFGSGFTAFPFFAAVHYLFQDLSLPSSKAIIWSLGRFVASSCVVVSTMALFNTCRDYVSNKHAMIIALSYSLGTCVWSISSQSLWQHGPNEMYLSLGIYYWSRWYQNQTDPKNDPMLCALFLSLSVYCRPTSVFVPLSITLYVVARRFKGTLSFLLVGAVLALPMLAYNNYYFGSIFNFGQRLAGETVAKYKTGSTYLWQTPFFEGMIGLLFSPSRGLFVFSPFMVFAVAGLYEASINRKLGFLLPLVISLAPLSFVAFTWFDWWGGWCYGYRPIVDTMPISLLFLIPNIEKIWKSLRWKTVYVVLLLFSVYVQFIGAFAYNGVGWNNKAENRYYYKKGDAVPFWVLTDINSHIPLRLPKDHYLDAVFLDVDLPENRHRLWSWTDNEIHFYHATFTRAREIRRVLFQEYLDRKLEPY